MKSILRGVICLHLLLGAVSVSADWHPTELKVSGFYVSGQRAVVYLSNTSRETIRLGERTTNLYVFGSKADKKKNWHKDYEKLLLGRIDFDRVKPLVLSAGETKIFTVPIKAVGGAKWFIPQLRTLMQGGGDRRATHVVSRSVAANRKCSGEKNYPGTKSYQVLSVHVPAPSGDRRRRSFNIAVENLDAGKKLISFHLEARGPNGEWVKFRHPRYELELNAGEKRGIHTGRFSLPHPAMTELRITSTQRGTGSREVTVACLNR